MARCSSAKANRVVRGSYEVGKMSILFQGLAEVGMGKFIG